MLRTLSDSHIPCGQDVLCNYRRPPGDHEILVEKVLPPEPGVKYPLCVQGKRACPPEDVGGVWGYDTFLEVIRDPDHEEHDSYLEWIGGEFDPEAFDLDGINQELRRIK